MQRFSRFLVTDATAFSDISCIANINGLHIVERGSSLPPVISNPCGQIANSVGITALGYYAPLLCANAADAEVFHASPGRYTAGRGQESVTFVSDDEETTSMAMTSLF